AGCALAGPLGDGVRFALDKRLQTAAASRAGLLVPPTSVCQSTAEVLAREGELPLILKPAQAVIAGKDSLQKGDNWICANREELNGALAKWREKYPLIVQPYISGTGVGVFGFATGGRVECWSAHRRLRMMNPHGSGSSACISKAVPQTLKGPIERMVRENGWQGLFMVEFLEDEAGHYWFIEFNGRAWGSMALSRRQGLEYPAWNAELALNPGFSIQRPESADSGVVCRNAGRELMHLLFVLRGRKSQAIRRWPSFWRAAADVLTVRRRDYFYNFRRDDWHVFFSDLICTIRNQFFKSRKGEQKT
ncbi:MAG TPA: hypothetical protein VKV04_02930, partial [Verrucomicrobiae bacterium]|nr:hypothetical protein [Verrucomicrobiae bacterium]